MLQVNKMGPPHMCPTGSKLKSSMADTEWVAMQSMSILKDNPKETAKNRLASVLNTTLSFRITRFGKVKRKLWGSCTGIGPIASGCCTTSRRRYKLGVRGVLWRLTPNQYVVKYISKYFSWSLNLASWDSRTDVGRI